MQQTYIMEVDENTIWGIPTDYSTQLSFPVIRFNLNSGNKQYINNCKTKSELWALWRENAPPPPPPPIFF